MTATGGNRDLHLQGTHVMVGHTHTSYGSAETLSTRDTEAVLTVPAACRPLGAATEPLGQRALRTRCVHTYRSRPAGTPFAFPLLLGRGANLPMATVALVPRAPAFAVR